MWIQKEDIEKDLVFLLNQSTQIWFFQLPQATAADSDLSSRGQNVCSGLMDMVLADLAEVLSMHSVFSCYQITVIIVICCFMLLPNWKHHHPVVNWFAPRKVRYCGLSFYFIIFMVNWGGVYYKPTSLITSLALNCGVEKNVFCISWWFGTNSTHSSCILQTFKALRFSCTRTNFESV